MKRRILKQKLNKVSNVCKKPVVECDIQYLVQEYDEVENNWKTIKYNTHFNMKVPAVFSNIEIAKLCYLGELGVVEEKVIQTGEINLKES